MIVITRSQWLWERIIFSRVNWGSEAVSSLVGIVSTPDRCGLEDGSKSRPVVDYVLKRYGPYVKQQ